MSRNLVPIYIAQYKNTSPIDAASSGQQLDLGALADTTLSGTDESA
eukprot:UN07379